MEGKQTQASGAARGAVRGPQLEMSSVALPQWSEASSPAPSHRRRHQEQAGCPETHSREAISIVAGRMLYHVRLARSISSNVSSSYSSCLASMVVIASSQCTRPP